MTDFDKSIRQGLIFFSINFEFGKCESLSSCMEKEVYQVWKLTIPRPEGKSCCGSGYGPVQWLRKASFPSLLQAWLRLALTLML